MVENAVNENRFMNNGVLSFLSLEYMAENAALVLSTADASVFEQTCVFVCVWHAISVMNVKRK